jgi:predicted ABC-type ATPase
MFAGPNGSGKSHLKSFVSPDWLGVYLNADEMEAAFKSPEGLSLSQYQVRYDEQKLLKDLLRSSLIHQNDLQAQLHHIRVLKNTVYVDDPNLGSYLASALSELIRERLVDRGISLSFETVMSHASKLDQLRSATRKGYRTYLYYVATDDPNINIRRVRARVARGGHAVPEDKIVDRYYRSLDFLYDAIKLTDRAYIFDNSLEGSEMKFLGEVTDGKKITVETDRLIPWFRKYILEKIT